MRKVTSLAVRGALTFALAATLAGCSGSSAGPSTNSVNLSGIWTGAVGAGSGGGRALRITWLVNQAGDIVSGMATVSTSPAVTDITFSGMLGGSIAGSRVLLTFNAPRGSVPGAADCSVTGTGFADVSGGAVAGALDIVFASCDSLGLQPPASDQMTLTKQ